jgi:hypothetical protein
MSTTKTMAHENQASSSAPRPELQTADPYGMTPRARKIVYLALLAGVLFLGSVAAYVWYGFHQWQSIR